MNNNYHGYPNRETWLFYCHEGEYLEDCILELLEDSDSILEYGQVYSIVNGHLDQLLEDHKLVGSSLFNDLLGNSIRNLDLHYITQKIYDEIVLQYNDKD